MLVIRNAENSSHLDAIRSTKVSFYLPAIFVLVLQRLPVISELLSLPGGGLVAGQICWLNGGTTRSYDIGADRRAK